MTRHRATALALLLALAGPAHAGAPAACAIPGEPVHWIADWCMLQLETDDEIAASDCIDQELKVRHASACAGKAHYKKRMCERMIQQGTRAGTLDQCVKDPAFMGSTVERGGVGG